MDCGRCAVKLPLMKLHLPASLLFILLLAGCAHGPPRYGETRREENVRVCAEAANALDISVKLKPDGTCDITHWSP